MIFEKEDRSEWLNSIIKIGEVSSVDYARGTARVVFDDDDSVVSFDLPVLHTNTYANKDYGLPDPGEDVLCIFLPSGPEEGFVIGSFYAGEITPPESNKNRRTVVFSDGSRVCYDRAEHKLTVTLDGTEIVFDRQNGSITVPQAVTINCTTATVNASESVKLDTPKTDVTGVLNVTGLITGMGGLSVSGGRGGASISCAGNMNLNGTIAATGDVTAGGVSLQGHTHTGDSGGSTSVPK